MLFLFLQKNKIYPQKELGVLEDVQRELTSHDADDIRSALESAAIGTGGRSTRKSSPFPSLRSTTTVDPPKGRSSSLGAHKELLKEIQGAPGR